MATKFHISREIWNLRYGVFDAGLGQQKPSPTIFDRNMTHFFKVCYFVWFIIFFCFINYGINFLYIP